MNDEDRFVMDVADMTDEEILAAAEALANWFQEQRRLTGRTDAD